MEMMNPQNFWKKYSPGNNQTLMIKAGYAEVLIKHVARGWQVKSRTADQPSDLLSVNETEDLTDDQDVLHFYAGNSNQLLLVPALPDKAVVFRNTKNIKLSAGESASLFFRIPLNIQFYFDEIKEENRIAEVPLQRLSDTWFGEMDNGEPAYSIGSNYYRSVDETEAKAWEAIVPVEIINNTFGVLELQRLILRVEEFTLYLNNGRILTSHVAIEFKGLDQAESVSLSTHDEIHGTQPEMIAKCRYTESKRLLRRSFFFIKNIYQS